MDKNGDRGRSHLESGVSTSVIMTSGRVSLSPEPSPPLNSTHGTPRHFRQIVICLLSASLLAAAWSLGPASEEARAYTPHAPISINSDADFTAANGVISGSGIPSDPYVIEGWEIAPSSSNAIEIYNTRSYFMIRDVFVHSAPFGYAGVWLGNVSNGWIENSTATGNWQGLAATLCSNITFIRNIATGNGGGLGTSQSRGIRFLHNNASYNTGGVGIGTSGSFNTTIEWNTLIGNNWGILAQWDTDAVIRGNDIRQNTEGIKLYLSSGTKVHHNAFFGNNLHAKDDRGPQNAWDNGYPKGGNFWDNYTGNDVFSGPFQNLPGGDGIGDTPYVIDGNSRDRYPLMKPAIAPMPDLSVDPSDISFSPPLPLKEGAQVFISAEIWNLGSIPSNQTTARFYDGYPPSAKIGSDQPLPALPDGGSANVSVPWTPMGPGIHEICVVADPDDLISEAGEADNIACLIVEVAFYRHLTPGNRLMSFPLVVVDDSVGSVLSSISGCYDYVRRYDPLDTASPWKSYVPGRGYDSLHRLDNTMGFWINVTSACDLVIVGVRPSTTTVNLHQGWNMVGFPSFKTTYAVADLKADIGLAGVIVEAFDAGAAPYYLQRVQDSYVMKAGEGYWVYVPSDATWTIGG